jgi:hypothetical protein
MSDLANSQGRGRLNGYMSGNTKFRSYAFLVATALVLFSCGIESNPRRAEHAKRRNELTCLLLSLEAYKREHGSLPANLAMLAANDTAITNVALEKYEYYPEGKTASDGSRWLLVTEHPVREGEVIVGRLPLEIISQQRLSAYQSCITLLKVIEGAKANWAYDQKKQDDDEPKWSDLVGEDAYLKEMPKCPQGGQYSLNKVGAAPTCSYDGDALRK